MCLACTETGAETQSLATAWSRYCRQYLNARGEGHSFPALARARGGERRRIADKTGKSSRNIFPGHSCSKQALPACSCSTGFLRERASERARARDCVKSDKPACKLRNGKSLPDINSCSVTITRAPLTSFGLTVALRAISEVY